MKLNQNFNSKKIFTKLKKFIIIFFCFHLKNKFIRNYLLKGKLNAINMTIQINIIIVYQI